ncbi:unnamed protein product, partial [Mesorhabditis belari]|uniref:glutathione transferase n=1 Tax=Mesorhabditis belari TaxID=2138241 RepID=A0AAF3ERP1_9BILA
MAPKLLCFGKKKMPYKLYYFDGRGTGEAIRQVFKLANEPFEDIRFSMEEWPKHKEAMPFGQVPVLEVDGEMIPQSAAIGRFVARKFGLGGKTPAEEAWVDAIVDLFKDHYNEVKDWYYTALGFMNKGDKNELYKSVYEPARDKFYTFLQQRLKKNGTGFLVGKSATWADLLIADHMLTVIQLKPDALSTFPEMLAFKRRIEELPQIKKWIETRPKTPF